MAWYYYAAVAAVKLASSVAEGNSNAASFGAQKTQARLNARAAYQQGSAAEDAQRRENALKLGEQRAAAAQSGFSPSSASMLEMQGESAANLELDALTTRYNSIMKAVSFTNEASRHRASEVAARTSGWMSGIGNAASTFAGGAGGGYGG